MSKTEQNSHAFQTISKAPSQSATANMVSASKYVDLPGKFNIDRQLVTFVEVEHLQSTCCAEAQFFDVYCSLIIYFKNYVTNYISVKIFAKL